MSNSLRPHGQQPTRLLHPRDSLGSNTGVGCHLPLLLEGLNQPEIQKGNHRQICWIFANILGLHQNAEKYTQFAICHGMLHE